MQATIDGISAGDSALFLGASYGRYGTRYKMNRVYDNGSGPLWFYQDAGGLIAIVRADTWESAYECCEDEIFDDADVESWDADEMRAAEDEDNPELPEGCHYRPNGNGSHRWNQTGIYQEDLNGSQLNLLTADDMQEHGIVIHWQSWGD